MIPPVIPPPPVETDDWLSLVDRCLPEPASADDFVSASATWMWVQKAREVLPVLRHVLRTQPDHSAERIRLATQRALSRVLRLMKRCDDEDGELLQLMHAFIDVLNQTLLQAPAPAAWGPWLLNALLDAPAVGPAGWDVATTLEAAGVLVAQSYEQCLIQAWSRMKLGETAVAACNRLFELRVLTLQQKNDVQAVMSFLAATASCEFTDAALVEYAQAQGCYRDALRYAQAAVQRFPDSQRLQELLLRAYESSAQHVGLALKLRQDVFAHDPSVKNFQALIRAGDAAGIDTKPLRKQAYEAVAGYEKLSLKSASRAPSPGASPGSPKVGNSWSENSVTGSGFRDSLTPESWWMVVRGPDVTMRVSLLLFEGLWQEALEWVALPNVCQASVLVDLAQALPVEHDDEALALLDRAMRQDLASEPPRTEWALVSVAISLQRLTGTEKNLEVPETGFQDKKSALIQRLQGEFHQAHAEFVAGLARL